MLDINHITIGYRYEKLVITAEVKRGYLCNCDCGTTDKFVCRYHFIRGNYKSCGCNLRTHNKTGSMTYLSWAAMRQRCLNKKHMYYMNYGGRGISICERWNSFENFLEDMGERPSKKHSLDRYPDKNGNYEPGNCRWATQKQQTRNTNSNRIITHLGRSLALCEWAEEFSIPVTRLEKRLSYGIEFSDALLPGRLKPRKLSPI